MYMPTSDGFSTDLAGIKVLGGFSSDRAKEVRDVSGTLATESCASEDQFATAETLASYNNFLSAWIDELSIIAGGLDELHEKFVKSAGNYDNSDVHWSHKFQNVAPKDEKHFTY